MAVGLCIQGRVVGDSTNGFKVKLASIGSSGCSESERERKRERIDGGGECRGAKGEGGGKKKKKKSSRRHYCSLPARSTFC